MSDWSGMEGLSVEATIKLESMTSIPCRGTSEHKAPKVRMNLVCFRKRKKDSVAEVYR